MDHGQFSGEPVTRWITTPKAPDRDMEMVEDFRFELGKNCWEAKKGSAINGASIPQPLWSLVGSPYTGDYRRASIVHDIACEEAGKDHAKRRAADRMFYHACRAGCCDVGQAILLYVGVRIGAWWNEHRGFANRQVVKLKEDDDAEEMRDNYHDIGKEVLDQGEVDDAEVVEERTDRAMARRGLLA